MSTFEFDEIGPSKVIELYFSRTGFRAIVVVDNTALGPSIGGVRVSRNVSIEEIKRLARTMTMKNAIAGLPHGGGKAGIIADPSTPEKEHYFRLFARAIRELNDYIPGPDMGSNEDCMAWINDEIGRAVGLPEEIGGLPLDKLGATGYGISECAEIACPYVGIELKNSKVAIQGFGSVGKASARYLSKQGAVIVAVSDTHGTVYDPNGLDVEELLTVKESTGTVVHYKKGDIKSSDEVFVTPCDILIPAATPDVINKDNATQIKAKMIIQGANIPATLEAEEILHKRGILSVPDFIANAGGVIMAAAEYANRSEDEAFKAIKEKISKNTKMILERSLKEDVMPRHAAVKIARERVLNAMRYRGDL